LITNSSAVSIDPTLFEWLPKQNGPPNLLASRCLDCGTIQFPQQTRCPACSGDSIDVVPLAKNGTIWSWTTQEFPPSSPPYAIPSEEFKPYFLGYVELPGEIRIETQLLMNNAETSPRVGMQMDLTFEPLFENENGETVMMFAFREANPNSE